MSQNQNIEVKLKFVVDDSGAKVIDQMTGATKQAAKAEEEYQKKLNARIKAIKEQQRLTADLQKRGVIEGPRAAPTVGEMATAAAERMRQQQAVHAELVRRGVVEGPKPVAPPATVAEEARRRIEAITRGQAVQAEMARLGYGPPAKPQGPGFGRQFGSALLSESSGGVMGTLSSPAAMAAGAVYAAKAGIDSATAIGRIQDDAFLTRSQKHEASMGAVPLFGYGFRKGREISRTLRGEYAAMSGAERDREEGAVNAQGAARMEGLRFRLGLRERIARYNAGGEDDIFRRLTPLQLDRPAGYDRTTVRGERLYHEEQQMLPLRQQLIQTVRKRVEAEHAALVTSVEANSIADKARDAQRHYQQLHAQRLQLSAQKNPDQGVLSQKFADEVKAKEFASGLNEQAKMAADHALEMRLRAAEANVRESQDRATIKKQELATAEQREQTAFGQARNLAAMGPAGRAAAKISLQLIDRSGDISMMPPEIQQTAAAAFPEKVRKLQEQAGAKYLPEFAKLSPEYRDTDLRKTVERTDAARGEAIRAQEATILKNSQAFHDALKGLLETQTEFFLREIGHLRDAVSQGHFRANQPTNR